MKPIEDEKLLIPPSGLLRDTEKRLWAFEEVSKRALDWVIFSNDNVLFVEENLLAYLSSFDASKPHYLGSRLRAGRGIAFNSASAMVLSAPALNALVRRCGSTSTRFLQLAYDLQVAQCLAMRDEFQGGILPADTRDTTDADSKTGGSERFMLYGPVRSANGVYDAWYKRYKAAQGGPAQSGVACCSAMPVAVHYVEAEEMRLLHAILFTPAKEKSTRTSGKGKVKVKALDKQQRSGWQGWYKRIESCFGDCAKYGHRGLGEHSHCADPQDEAAWDLVLRKWRVSESRPAH